MPCVDVFIEIVVLHRAELDLELRLVPDERAVDRLLAAQAPEVGVDHLPLAEVDVRRLHPAREVNDAALPRHLEGLQEIDDGHVGDRPAEARLPPGEQLVLRRDVLLRPSREEQVHARQELPDEDRLRQVVLDAELEAANLVLDRLLARQEDDGDDGPLRLLLELPDERVAVELREARVGEDEIGRREIELRQRVLPVGGRGYAVAGLLQADFEHADAARIGVHQQ